MEPRCRYEEVGLSLVGCLSPNYENGYMMVKGIHKMEKELQLEVKGYKVRDQELVNVGLNYQSGESEAPIWR